MSAPNMHRLTTAGPLTPQERLAGTAIARLVEAKLSIATRIFDLAERVDRNVQRNDEAFHIERDEIVRELKELAMEARG